MPNLSLYRKLNAGHTNGEQRKLQSDMIMEATWDEDITTRDAYFYDWYHDNYKTQLIELKSTVDSNKIPMRIKFLVNSSQTMDKDPITYHLQMKPSQECVVKYYDEFFKNRYDAMYPCGLYADIPDSKGIHNRWLVVAEANSNDPQFPTFELLKCNKIIQYVFNGKKYNVPAVLRSQNSYNSGVWRAYRFEDVEDQQKFIVPLNRDTENIYYNQRIIVDNKILTEPRTWRVTKVDRLHANGLLLITLAQDKFDQFHDQIELDEDGNVIGMWADWFTDGELHKEEPKPELPKIHYYSSISYAGTSPEVKIGGSYKKFTVTFFEDDKEVPYKSGTWSYFVDGVDVSSLITESTNALNPNQIKIKFADDNDYIGKVLTIKYRSYDGDESSLKVELVSL